MKTPGRGKDACSCVRNITGYISHAQCGPNTRANRGIFANSQPQLLPRTTARDFPTEEETEARTRSEDYSVEDLRQALWRPQSHTSLRHGQQVTGGNLEWVEEPKATCRASIAPPNSYSFPGDNCVEWVQEPTKRVEVTDFAL